MSDKKTKVFDLYGGPGTGKSTSAALMYAYLKLKGVNSELVREYVKDWAWEERKINTYDQLYLLGKQIRRESLVYGKTDVIVTDSPVMLGIYYSRRFSPPDIAEAVEAAAMAFYRQASLDGYEHIHVMLNRIKPYESAGRYQTEAEAKDIDGGVERMLNEFGVKYVVCDPTEEDLQQLLSEHGF